MEVLPAIFLLVILNSVWARVPPQDVNGTQTTDGNSKSIFNPKDYKLLDEFYPENDRDAIPIVKKLLRLYGFVKTVVDPVAQALENPEGSGEGAEQDTRRGLIDMISHSAEGNSSSKNSTETTLGTLSEDFVQLRGKLLKGALSNPTFRTFLSTIGITPT